MTINNAINGITLTGDVTGSTGGNSIVTTLANINANVGTFGSASQSIILTANAKGQLTALSDVTITPAAIGAPTLTGTGASGTWGISITGNAGTVTTNANLTGDVTSIGNATTIANLAVTNAKIANSTIDLAAKVTGILPFVNGGTNAALTASLGGVVYSTATALSILSGTATANLPLLSQANVAPIWGAFALNLGGAFTSSGAVTFSGAFPFTGTLTASTGVTFPTSGTLATTSQLVALPVSMTNGGTGAALTASLGGLFYSTATTGAVLAGTATAGQIVRSGANAAPTWSTSTYPATNVINTLLYASAVNVMSALATANSGVLVTSAGGVPSISSTLPSGLTIPGYAANGVNADITSMTGLTGTIQAPTGITSSTGLSLLAFTYTASAVNQITVTNATTTNSPMMSATGTDTNIILTLDGKGTGGASIGGTATNDNAVAGQVGEFISATLAFGAAISLTTGVTSTITSISLTAGDWDVSGIIGTSPAATTSITQIIGGISTTSAIVASPGSGNRVELSLSFTVGSSEFQLLPIGPTRISISTTTTINLLILCTFTVSTMTGYGFIRARRMR